MAKNDLTLNVGTKYNGEGIKKLDNALKTSAKTASNATKALGSISSELGQMTGNAGKAAQAVSGLFSSLATGGPVAVAIAAITAGVGLLIKAFNDAKQLAKDAATSMRDGFSKAFDASVKQIDKMKSSLAEVLRMNAQASQNKSAERDINSRASQNATSDLAVDNMARTGDESERARTAALERRSLAIQQAEDKRIKATEDNVKAIEGNIKVIEEAKKNLQAELQEQMDALEKERSRIEKSGLAKQYEELKRAVADAEQDIREKGAGAIVGSKTRWIANSAGGTTSYEVGITTTDVQQSAVKKLKEFEDANETVVKDLENLHTIQEKFAQSSKSYDDVTKQLTNEQKKLDIATQNAIVANAEYETTMKQIQLKFQDEMKAIDERLAAEAKASEERIKAEEAAKEALNAKINQQILEADKQREIQNLQDARARLLNQDKKSAVERLEERKKEQEAAKKLAEAERKAADILNQWKANPQQSFNAWNNAQRDAAKQAEKDAKQQAKNSKQAQDNANAIASRIFDANGNIKGRANAFDIGRFAEQADFLGFENVDKAQLQSLQSKRDELRNKLFNADGTLKRGVNERGQDMGLFKQLDGALKKLDAVKDAEDKRKEAEEREKQRAINEDKRTRALEDIDTQIKTLTTKVEI